MDESNTQHKEGMFEIVLGIQQFLYQARNRKLKEAIQQRFKLQ